MMEVKQEVQVLHQSEPADQVRAGEMRQLRRFCGGESQSELTNVSMLKCSQWQS